MIDGIKGSGKNTRLLQASLPASYEEFKALVEGDGLPLDLLFNAAGWQQLPTMLSKANLLSDDTAYQLGLDGDDPTVDEALARLGDQIETGTYVGTGGVGVNNPVTINFNFAPKLVMVTAPESGLDFMISGYTTRVATIWHRGVTRATAYASPTSGDDAYVDYLRYSADNSVFRMWVDRVVTKGEVTTSPSASLQLNASGTTYAYIGIGNMMEG